MQPYIIAPHQGSDPADEWLRLGIDAHMHGDHILAQKRYEQALRLNPRNTVAVMNLAVLFAQEGLHNDAMLAIDRAYIIDDTHELVYLNKALMLLEAGRISEAMHLAELGHKTQSDTNSRLILAMIYTQAGDHEKAMELYRQILKHDPTHLHAGLNLCYSQTVVESTPEEMLVARLRWHDANCQGLGYTPRPHANDRSPSRPLRIGYVGGDFKTHSSAFISSRMILNHSPDYIPYIYSTLPVDPKADRMTKRLQEAVGDRWRDISAINDAAAEQLIRNDRIDILVDLSGHTLGSRLKLFTRKPAPIAVTAWGFAVGTGCPEIDYFFADPTTIPCDERQYFVEQIYNLPCIMTFEPQHHYNLLGASQPPWLRNNYFTFGVFTRHDKLSLDFLQAVGTILAKVPESRIVFKDLAFRTPYAINRVHEAIQSSAEIESDRLLFSTATNHPDNLLSYQQCDLILDTWPHGGGVAGIEQLWMGVPILTKHGNNIVGRLMSSVLTNIGREDWIARSREEYIDKAVELATSRHDEIIIARRTLRDELMKSPVIDDYVARVEAGYRHFWERYIAA